jgi:hypothetical protein
MYIMKKTLILLSALAILALPSFGQTISGKSNSVTLQFFDLPASSPPAIVWINPDRGSITTDQSQFMIKLGINSHPRLKIKSVKVYKNNKALTSLGAGEPGSSLAAQFTRYIEQDLLLDAGQNEIKVVVENERGEMTTEYRSVTSNVPEVDRAPTFAELGINKLPVYHALIIGVSDYKYNGPGLSSLEKPAKDAEDLYKVLISKYAFTPENTTLLKSPTREEMIDAFDALTRKVQENDNVLIFYAGHGHHEKETGFGFWLPSDAKKESRSAWIANSTIKDYIGVLKSKHTLLITDACFSGSIFKTRRVDFAATALKIHEIYRDKSRKAITSGNLSEVPDESYFIKYLLKTLNDNEQVFLTASTLFSRLYEPVTNNTTTSPQFGVIQGAGDENGDFIFFRKME